MSMEEIKELIDSRQYTRLRQELAELQEADIAAVLEELPKDELIRVFRIGCDTAYYMVWPFPVKISIRQVHGLFPDFFPYAGCQINKTKICNYAQIHAKVSQNTH